MAAHVLDPAGDSHVYCSHRDLGCHLGGGRHRAGAHPVDGVPGDLLGQTRQEGDGPPKRQSLVADLTGRSHSDLAHELAGKIWISAHQFADQHYGQVIRSR